MQKVTIIIIYAEAAAKKETQKGSRKRRKRLIRGKNVLEVGSRRSADLHDR